jgi:hypothetical protein
MRIILAVSVHDFSSDWVDYVVHFGIDVMGTLATLYAQRYCKHRTHQFLIWFGLSVLVTATTVKLVG